MLLTKALLNDRRYSVSYVRRKYEFFLLQIPIDWFTCSRFSWYRRIMVAKKRGKRFLHGGWTRSWALGLPCQIVQGNTTNRSQMFQKGNRIWQVKQGFSFISQHNVSGIVFRSCKTYIEFEKTNIWVFANMSVRTRESYIEGVDRG